MKKSFVVFLIVLVGFLAVSCKKSVAPALDTNTLPITPLPTLKGSAPFLIGASIDPTFLRNNLRYRETLISEFNSITIENMMKMNNIQPERARFDYARANELVSFANQEKMRIHGHALVWHEALPGWISTFQGDSLAWENLFKTHIQTVASYYKGKLAGWDVVNEAIDNDGGTRNDNSSQGSIWRRKLGADYIARAFLYAKEADPNAILFYNDYAQESNPKKLEAILRMVEDLRKSNVPVEGLGLQMHIHINTPDAGIVNAITKYVKTGLKIHISELDIQLNPSNETLERPTVAQLEAQRLKFLTVVRAYKTLVPKEQQYGITQWNVGDADSWLRTYLKKNEFPLPFDMNYEKKVSYYGILEGLR